ncbi:MAG: FolB domain-containing protein [Deltaproteobacteria bacterium]|jgi:FolB domain-containing protein|nr:FolB domain-containing protein [Deltaproteobacteria bacterium]MBT6434409.1 FolB domain-containing protein [Deltaproteobacteria bacterium]MBT6492132.1 FolB domain-containing protein [Deltaproteobacteria bacterium]
MTHPADSVRLRGFRAECIVGIYPAERKKEQWVELDLSLHLDTRRAGRTGALDASIDYARLCGEIRFLLKACRFKLLEEAAEAICAYVLAEPTGDGQRCSVDAVTLELTKPAALGDIAMPSVRVYREASEYCPEVETQDFGRVDIIAEGKGFGIYRLRIAPGAAIKTHVHRVMCEHELVLGDGLLLQNKPVGAGWAHCWPLNFPHRYDNPTDQEQTILCVDKPPFIPDDEVAVDEPLGDLKEAAPEFYYPLESVT